MKNINSSMYHKSCRLIKQNWQVPNRKQRKNEFLDEYEPKAN